MFHQVSRFVSRFRDLEQQNFPHSYEEERRWKSLKDKLSIPEPEAESHPSPLSRTCIVVASLYEQAGASFVASNVAYAWASKGIPVTLCELPGAASYFYFALDYERRVKPNINPSTILMQDNRLRIQIDVPAKQQETPQVDPANWLLRTGKGSPVVMIDASSRWRAPGAAPIFEIADEIWVVIDADLARLTRLFLVEATPPWWETERSKIKIIANKWNDYLSRSSMIKKVEGTLSLWNLSSCPIEVDAILPALNGEKTAKAQSRANLLLELFPEEEHAFQSLIHAYKGRMT